MCRHALTTVTSGLLLMMAATCLAAPAGEHDLNFVLTNLTALWEEVAQLQHSLEHHVHGDPPHDQVAREVDVMKHEEQVHHHYRSHEGHNDHHDPHLLQHLEHFHDHDHHHHDGHHDHGHHHHGDHGHHHPGGHGHHHDGHGHHHDGHGHHHDGHGHHHDGHDHHHHRDNHDHHHHDDHGHHHHNHHHEEDSHDRHGLHPTSTPKPVAKVGRPVMVGPVMAAVGGRAMILGRGEHEADQEEWAYAHCTLKPNADLEDGSVNGTVVLSQKKGEPGPVFFHINIQGFNPSQGRVHGFHIHESQISNDSCATAGGHFNPFGATHGGPDSETRHLGDLGNIEVDSEGKLENFILTDNVLTLLRAGNTSVSTRSIVIHAGEDDLGLGGDEGSLTTGNAGGRLACCNIYITATPLYRFKG